MKLLLFSSVGVLLTCLVCPFKFLWGVVGFLSSLVFLMGVWLLGGGWCIWWSTSSFLGVDSIGFPLIVLSCWLLPLTLLASRGHMSSYSMVSQRVYCILLVCVLVSLMVTFSSLELVLFYMSFEATLIPILVMISRWGSQYERYQASMYFMFYTLFGSLPFLVSLFSMKFSLGTLFLPFFDYSGLCGGGYMGMWWFFTFVIFMVKMPIYGFHLWLPKAHVEATVGGSMLLAAVLLKLGGYGLIRLVKLFTEVNLLSFSSFMASFCIWGALMTGVICLCQSDLKALMAYSSVGHMSLVASGVFMKTSVGVNGAMVLMVAHGLVSSGLFCLAKFLYERSGTRTLGLMRGYKFLMVLMGGWWLVSCVANLGLPPLPNLIGELMIIASLGSIDFLLLIVAGVSTVASAVYSLLIYQFTQSKKVLNVYYKVSKIFVREHLLMFLHLVPLFLLVMKPSVVCVHF